MSGHAELCNLTEDSVKYMYVWCPCSMFGVFYVSHAELVQVD